MRAAGNGRREEAKEGIRRMNIIGEGFSTSSNPSLL
jgi:hypothetical protein